MAKKREWGGMNFYKPGVDVDVVPVDGVPPPIDTKAAATPKQKKLDVWLMCEECGREIWTDYRGQYYHKLACSKSNGIAYGDEISDKPMIPHHVTCDCLRCKAR